MPDITWCSSKRFYIQNPKQLECWTILFKLLIVFLQPNTLVLVCQIHIKIWGLVCKLAGLQSSAPPEQTCLLLDKDFHYKGDLRCLHWCCLWGKTIRFANLTSLTLSANCNMLWTDQIANVTASENLYDFVVRKKIYQTFSCLCSIEGPILCKIHFWGFYYS